MYELKIASLINDIDDLIIDTLGTYDTNDLETIIEGLICNHAFSSKDSIQNLIYSLEKLQDYMEGEES